MKKYAALAIVLVLLTGCGQTTRPIYSQPTTISEKKGQEYEDLKKQSFRARDPIPEKISRYEGSLWEDEASWGNLLRDHRARFRGDLVKITNLQDVISVPSPKDKAAATPVAKPIVPGAKAGEVTAEQINQLIDAMNGTTKAEEEQNEVLASLRSISAYVQSVLPNGNMVIVGEKVDYRQQNTVRYITTIKGIIRPADVTDANEVPAIKLARFEPKIRRQMLAQNLKNLAPIVGTQKAGLLDRLSHLATPTKKTNPPTTVNTQ